ncbi:Gfo/Idh/MocA family oxidoreductase [Xenorhabdus nematophila]|uniref:Gfo/Idh/MocA family protein n=1 Tax=Xenorhabdus nematophila TaxID=628 RepID=UPI0003275961|nr:Gfo/Idh/MocA family oxidoreductase [Xenorhabdus nematophila]CEE93593.1 putative Oxidoreductase, gfo/idh/moca family [Xenorhabdus nematophila str. Anatoliense]CEF29535.1 putative Oxidoreductase, gfo/idh/moca family [Xenorhabdus nematophila str. Websteri]AYA39643.1 gfo/Idh/MocA family oxidoreductase [Xenorhabdus nematophila]MBA0018212.1 Gfo/Idh/MocA family oxidoreductase [Xenorhabdus nematophila]MCB4426541.1 Gfo/Idh/MocA family oxidoreductase [Xenorhabdus nematophila]
MKKIRWGIIGCGDVTEIKSGPAFYTLCNSELIAVMRRNAYLAENFARRHRVPKWYTNAESLVNDPDVEAVYIATPPSTHKEYTILAANAGKPVYVEKPMALTFQECNEMISVCRTQNVPLFVAYYRRALPKFIKIKELIEHGKIGTPRIVNCMLFREIESCYTNPHDLPWLVKPEISGGGLFVDLACHTIDILDFLLGKIISVKGHANSQKNAYPAEDCVSMSFIFENSVQGVGIWNFVSGSREDKVEIIGTKGKISFSTFGNSAISYYDENNKLYQFNFENPKNIEMPLIKTIIDELQGNGNCPSTAESASRTNWVIDEVLKNYRITQSSVFKR